MKENKYMIQLCEVNKEVLAMDKERKDNFLTTQLGVFQEDNVFLNHEAIIVVPSKYPGMVKEYFTGKEIPLVSLEIYRNLDKKIAPTDKPYAYYVNSNLKSTLFGFQIIYHDMNFKVENEPFNRKKVTDDDLKNFMSQKGMSLDEYKTYLLDRFRILEEEHKNNLNTALKRVKTLWQTKK